ncbi:hypothetical protein Nepgr_005484 [Nepenthes gracilis]|uniref:DUF642 domain-containing protein n=1 Tax=Nepenthes gracilis TaxID=150966 RepID=A0AAD3XGH0_NEPGR|nr:hypothetical protein Nepgr_005484 [Nepenthes gracilis]
MLRPSLVLLLLLASLNFSSGALCVSPTPFFCSTMLRPSLVLLLLLASLNFSSGGLLPNGNFESGPLPSELSGTRVRGKNAIPNWETSGFIEYIKSGYKQGDMILVVPEGKCAVRLGNEASIKQKTIYSSVGFDTYAWGFLAEDDEIKISLHNPGMAEDPACGPLIDTVAINILHPPRPTNANLLKNANFEEGPYVFHNSSWGVLIPPNIEDDHSPLPAWMVESLKAVKYIDSHHFSVPEGKRAVELVAGKESVIAQTIRTNPGKDYVLNFAIGDSNSGCIGPLNVEASVGKDTVTVSYESKGNGGFIRAKLPFKAESTRMRIRFSSMFYTMKEDGSLCGPVIDDVMVLSVRHPRHLIYRIQKSDKGGIEADMITHRTNRDAAASANEAEKEILGCKRMENHKLQNSTWFETNRKEIVVHKNGNGLTGKWSPSSVIRQCF